MICGTSEVVVDHNVVLRPGPDEPNGSLRLGQKATAGVYGRLVGVQGLHVVVGEPDPSSFKVGRGFAGQVDGQKCSKTLAVSDIGCWALRQLEFGSSGPSEADIGIPHAGAALDL